MKTTIWKAPHWGKRWGGFGCKHTNSTFVRKTYGDENNMAIDLGGRYIYKCDDCGRYVNKPEGPEDK